MPSLARAWGVASVIVAENGSVVCLDPGEGGGDRRQVPVGRLVLEGNRVVPLDSDLVRGRQKAVFNGSAVVTVVVDGWGQILAEPQIAAVGLFEDADDEVLRGRRRRRVESPSTVDVEGGKARRRYGARDDPYGAVRKVFRERLGKKPMTEIHFVRV